ncbi:MAG: hypothetical protein QOI40_1574, partial [Alphaproteobacteria bacterium]|nr:hypothetical protein [Alphaproteobacteria bacterium]
SIRQRNLKQRSAPKRGKQRNHSRRPNGTSSTRTSASSAGVRQCEQVRTFGPGEVAECAGNVALVCPARMAAAGRARARVGGRTATQAALVCRECSSARDCEFVDESTGLSECRRPSIEQSAQNPCAALPSRAGSYSQHRLSQSLAAMSPVSLAFSIMENQPSSAASDATGRRTHCGPWAYL